MDKRLKSIGEKTRKRFEEERKGRKEIQILETPEPILEFQATPTAKRKRTAQSIIVEPKRKPKPRFRPRSNQIKENDPNVLVDAWIPEEFYEYYHDDCNIPKAELSSCVRIHGIPRGCGPDISIGLIRKFFRGLESEVDQLFTLPPHDYLIEDFDVPKKSYCEGWDQSSKQQIKTHGTNTRVSKTGWVVHREPPSFRIFVKFRTKISASLAVERSGELASFSCTDYPGYDTLKVSLIITPLSRSVSKLLLNRMALVVEKGGTVRSAIEYFESAAFPGAEEITWCMAANMLKLRHIPKAQKKWDEIRMENDPKLQKLTKYFWPAKSEHEQQEESNKMIECHDALFDFHEMLEQNYWSSFLMHVATGTNTVSINRIVIALSEWIRDSIDRLEVLLRRQKMVSAESLYT